MKKLLYVALLALGVVVMMTPPVMAQEEKPFTIHGEVRFRGDYINNTQDFNNDADDGGLVFPYRVRIAAEGKFSKNVSAWIEFHHAEFAGNTGPFQSGNSADAELYQGNMTFDQLWSKNFSLRIGRQEIVAGNELLLGDLDFYTGISHDGGVGNWKLKKVNIMAWYTRPTENTFSFTNSPFPDTILIPPSSGGGTQHFLGGYATWNFNKTQTFDVYLMDLVDRGNGGDFQTVGVRWAHDTTGTGFFWDVEGVKQFGQFESAALGASGFDVDADGRALEGWFGFSIKSGKKIHRFYGRLESASGDKANTNGKNEGFLPLFGDAHNRLGHGDWFQMSSDPTNLGGGVPGGATGIQGLSAGYTGYFNDRHEFGVAFWQYKVAEENGSGNGKKLGTGADIWYGFNYSRNVAFTASLSELSPDDALTGAGAANTDTVQRLYGQARLRF
jgi:alginate export protein